MIICVNYVFEMGQLASQLLAFGDFNPIRTLTRINQLYNETQADTQNGVAKTLEAKNPESPSEPELILSMWRSCNELGNINNIDEDRWLIEARKRLKG